MESPLLTLRSLHRRAVMRLFLDDTHLDRRIGSACPYKESGGSGPRVHSCHLWARLPDRHVRGAHGGLTDPLADSDQWPKDKRPSGKVKENGRWGYIKEEVP
ncbi:hypothetical protein NDU88_007461 [Pleurodeles waltl]|uniref:Uncharacterized protein n=1 Tax=Pleurodeles waltl TaxID=8319 RepID=A0AAV7PLY4_PLEWA|nr:hypothetical protein NDU88_007461 [Pleurodeles waltl]